MNTGRIAELLRDRRVLIGLAAGLVVVTLVVAVCTGGAAPAPTTTTSSSTTSSTTTSSTSSSTTTTLGTARRPLTGEVVASDDPTLDQRVLVGKLDNSRFGRPQAGLAEADLVIEVLVEGGTPRLLAFYQSEDPERVGPMRSLREVDPKLVEPFDALVAHSGGVPSVEAAMAEVAVDLGHPVLEQAYTRDPTRPGPYDLFFDPAALRSAAPPWTEEMPRLLRFSERLRGGEPAAALDVALSPQQLVAYRFSQVDRGYLRFHETEPHLDEQGRHLSATNVVVLFVEQLSTGRRDVTGSPVPDYEVLGTGEALVFRGERVTEGTWERGRLEDFFRIFDSQRRELALSPGNTWIELAPVGQEVTWEE